LFSKKVYTHIYIYCAFLRLPQEGTAYRH